MLNLSMWLVSLESSANAWFGLGNFAELKPIISDEQAKPPNTRLQATWPKLSEKTLNLCFIFLLNDK